MGVTKDTVKPGEYISERQRIRLRPCPVTTCHQQAQWPHEVLPEQRDGCYAAAGTRWAAYISNC
jgi:hypothetical protein